MTIDGGTYMTLCGKGWTFVEYRFIRKANIIRCINNMSSKNRPIGTAITTVDIPHSQETFLLLVGEAIDHTDQATLVLSTYQTRSYGVDLYNVTKHHTVDGQKGRQSLIVDGIEVPFQIRQGLTS